MYRAGLESILGLRRRGATFEIDPCIPSSWAEYSIAWRFGATRYEIAVSNPERRCRGVAEAELDGAPVDPAAIPLVDDGGRPGAAGAGRAQADAIAGGRGRARVRRRCPTEPSPGPLMAGEERSSIGRGSGTDRGSIVGSAGR